MGISLEFIEKNGKCPYCGEIYTNLGYRNKQSNEEYQFSFNCGITVYFEPWYKPIKRREYGICKNSGDFKLIEITTNTIIDNLKNQFSQLVINPNLKTEIKDRIRKEIEYGDKI